MLLEGHHLVPAEDTLHVVRGIAVSRPNLFLEVTEGEAASFLADWKTLARGNGSWARFVGRRGHPRPVPLRQRLTAGRSAASISKHGHLALWAIEGRRIIRRKIGLSKR